jgi:hypothetical protein
METRSKPVTPYVALTDIYSAAGLLFPFIFLAIALIVTLTDSLDGARGYYLVSLLAALIGFPVSWWRVRNIRETLDHGVEVNGTVTHLRSGRGRSGNTRVKWEYTYGGRTYSGDAYVSNDGEVRAPAKGSKIRLWVNPNKPGWSVWRDLYTSALALGKG